MNMSAYVRFFLILKLHFTNRLTSSDLPGLHLKVTVNWLLQLEPDFYFRVSRLLEGWSPFLQGTYRAISELSGIWK